MQYAIYEGNIDRLRKKAKHIQNKCRKYGCNFRFEEVGEEFRKVKDENDKVSVRRFVLVEAEGTSIVNGWKFVATLNHTEEGNIIRAACDIEIPERFYTCSPCCEHCNSNRPRKETYIVLNEKTGEFKQVGKSCLKDFTNGMSIEGVSAYMSFFNDLIQGEAPNSNGLARTIMIPSSTYTMSQKRFLIGAS